MLSEIKRKILFMFMKYTMPALVLSLTLTACASKYSPDVVDGDEAARLSNVSSAKILDVRAVKIKGDKEVGAVTGAALGGLGGYTAGGNDELRAAGAVVGAIAGGIVGAAVQERTTTEQAYEYIIEREDGRVQTIIQTGEAPLLAGQNVYIIRSSERTRIIPAEQ